MDSSDIKPGDRVIVVSRFTRAREARVLAVSKPEGFIGTATLRWANKLQGETTAEFERDHEYFLHKLTKTRKQPA